MNESRFGSSLCIGSLTGLLLAGCVVGEEESAVEIGSIDAPLYGANDEDAIDGQYIVVFKDEASKVAMSAAMEMVAQASNSNRIQHSYTVIPGFTGTFDQTTLRELRRNPDVAYVEQDRTVSISAVQLDPPAGLDRIDQRFRPLDGRYDDRGFNGTGVHVYVIDTGIRADHVEFNDINPYHVESTSRVRPGATFIPDGRGTSDCNGQGTHVSSVVLGKNTGVAKNALVHPIRVLDCNGFGSLSSVIAGVDFVRNNAIRPAVANLGLSGGASITLDSAVNNLFNAGILPVVAAGDGGQNACNVSPARASGALTVGTVDGYDRRASFSNFGSCVDIHAPGANVLGAGISSPTAYVFRSGSPVATAHVTGVAAMFLHKSPGASSTQVRNAILNAATTGVLTNIGSGSPNRMLFNGI